MRTFALYSDFVVREMPNKSVKTIGEAGRFTLSKSGEFYSPDHYKSDRTNPEAELNILAIKGAIIRLNEFFSILEISERPEATHKHGRQYYRETRMLLKDVAGQEKEYNFHARPELEISHETYQVYFFKLRDEIEGNQTFREIELRKENLEKDEEIERLKQQLNDMKD